MADTRRRGTSPIIVKAGESLSDVLDRMASKNELKHVTAKRVARELHAQFYRAGPSIDVWKLAARLALRFRAAGVREALEAAAERLRVLAGGLNDGPFQDGVAMAGEEVACLAAEVE